MRHRAEPVRIESALAAERKKATQIKDGKTPVPANLPEPSRGESRRRAAEAVGLKPRTAEKGLAILEKAESGDERPKQRATFN